MSKLESDIQSDIRDYLVGQGFTVIKISNNPGWPDLMCMKYKLIYFIEVKRPGKKPDPLQNYTHRLLTSLGFTVYVATSVKELKNEFTKVRKRV